MIAMLDETLTIPSRHGADVARARQIARPVRWLVRGDPEPSAERWQALGEALLHGDPPMDRLIDWMRGHGMREARELFRQAVDRGIDAVPQAPAPLREFFASVDRRPGWLDDELLRRGAEASHRTGLTGMRALRDLALMTGYQASAINKTLVATGTLSRGPQRRLAETTKWWLDCTAGGGMDRFGEGFRNTLHVRFIHGLIRYQVQRQPDWRMDDWGLPVNQTDMAATQLGFSAIFLMGSRALGVRLSRADGEGVMHLWRYVGWLMGVDERWLPENETEGRRLLYHILLSQATPDESSRQLGRALMDEPLQRHYPRFGRLRGHYERARHISITRLFVDSRGMRDLGLPAWVPPWYPIVSIPVIFARHVLARLLPGGTARLARNGRKDQVDYLRILFGESTPAIHSPETE